MSTSIFSKHKTAPHQVKIHLQETRRFIKIETQDDWTRTAIVQSLSLSLALSGPHPPSNIHPISPLSRGITPSQQLRSKKLEG